jgi:arylsulfatase A-like enzyme
MASSPQPTESGGGIVVTLRAAFSAGLLAGLVLGIADGIFAALRAGTSGVLAWLGCIASATLLYGAVWIVALIAIGLALHVPLRSRAINDRSRALLALALGIGLFLDLYWWTRPWVLSGVPATDPRRLGLAALFAAVGLACGWFAVRLGARLPLSVRLAAAVAVPIAWIGGGVFMLVERAQLQQLGAINERNRDLPNVLFIVNDAMRADVLGCYGNTRVKTPRIDALAADGVVFTNALVQAPFTGSSFGSYFTGKYPRRHGFVKQVADARMAPNITLASHLKSAELIAGGKLQPRDYHCITFMTGALSYAAGLARGFDSYYEAMAGHELVDVDNPWSVFRSELVPVILATKIAQRFDDGAAASEAVRWLHDHGRERFFAMVHLFGTHTPYDPPRDLKAVYCDPNYSGPLTAFRSDHRQAIEDGAKPTDADVAQIRNLYYAGAAHNDRMIAAVLAELEAQGVLENTLVIVTADHGEELGDHGVWEHNHMYETNLRVPFVVAWPAKLPRGARVGAMVESVDLVPSVCDLLGLKPPYEDRRDAQGRNYGAIDGKSWLPLVRGDVQSIREFSFAENGLEMAVQDAQWKLIVPAVPLEKETLESLMANPIVKPRLFHLATDPGETQRNVIEHEPAQAERLLQELKKWDASMPIPRSDIIRSARDIRQLQLELGRLGYGDGVGQGVKPPPQDSPQKSSPPKAPDHK